ncbi:unnamed protein product [Discosporangium mesarthrocarpum]
MDDFTPEQCFNNFRFQKADILTLVEVVGIPDRVRTDNRSVFSRNEALLILLSRLAYPCRLGDQSRELGREYSQQSRVVSWMVEFIVGKHGHIITDGFDGWVLNLPIFADTIRAKRGFGEETEKGRVFALMDGTLRPHCRPANPGIQTATNPGCKRLNGIKFQGVVLPNGLLCDVAGPAVGRRNDAWLLMESNLNPKVCDALEGLPVQYVVYGDTAYSMLSQVKRGQRETYTITVEEREANKRMSTCRISIGRAFGKVLQLWPFLDFEKNSQLHLQPIAHLCIVGALLTNMHTCLYGSQTGHYFDLNPPGLKE